MSCCTQCRVEPCACCNDFTDPTDPSYREKFTMLGSMTGMVDCVRDLYTCFGTRAYSVHLVWTRWSGGERGIGVEENLREEQLLPVPKVEFSVDRPVEGVGIVENGTVSVSEISTRYTEDYLLGSPDGKPIPEDQNFYWEIRTLGLAEGPNARRRFFPRTVPVLDQMKLQWRASLQRALSDRDRLGGVR